MVAPFACASRRHIHDGTADLVMGHKGFAKFTVGCVRRVAAVNIETVSCVRCQMCCLSRASGVIVVVSGPSVVSVVFRLVRSWLFRNSGSWLRLFVARFWLADVG